MFKFEIRKLTAECGCMYDNIQYQLLGLSGLWAADSARSPIRSRSIPAPLHHIFQVPFPLIHILGPLRSIFHSHSHALLLCRVPVINFWESVRQLQDWWQSAIAKGRYRKSRYCHVMYKLLYPSIRVRTAPPVLVRVRTRVSVSFSFTVLHVPADFCDSGPLR